jgi:hypothetical protein
VIAEQIDEEEAVKALFKDSAGPKPTPKKQVSLCGNCLKPGHVSEKCPLLMYTGATKKLQSGFFYLWQRPCRNVRNW